MALTVADHIYIVSKGSVVYEGAPEDVARRPRGPAEVAGGVSGRRGPAGRRRGEDLSASSLRRIRPQGRLLHLLAGRSAWAWSPSCPWNTRAGAKRRLSWKKTCYLHAGLNPAPTFRVKGPDALKFFSDHCVNSFANFAVGALKHGIMCNDDGLVMAHGVLMRVAEDDFITYFLAPVRGLSSSTRAGTTPRASG